VTSDTLFLDSRGLGSAEAALFANLCGDFGVSFQGMPRREINFATLGGPELEM